MYLKQTIIAQNSKSINDFVMLDGLNGSGKTTLLREMIDQSISINVRQQIDNHVRKKIEREQYTWITETNVHSRMDQEYAIEMYYFSGLKTINKKIEHYSSGQKKKLLFVSLVVGNSHKWYMDEPNSYFDSLSYSLLKNKTKQHLNIGGKIIITSNTSTILKTLKKKISLSRFELLTTRLSSECSTTEL